MKEIVIISGKGGVGKSAVTASLGFIFAQKHRILLTDTDVDAPNLHLIVGGRLLAFQEVSASAKAFIDYEKCSGCLTCVETCRFSAIVATNGPIIVPYSCEGCGACVLNCPEEAIEIRNVVNGRINIFETDNLPVVAGELCIGASSSGRLVDLVKRRARQEGETAGAEIILTDGPPGIGCPVIAALKGADYGLLVTEPSKAALNDLERVMEVAGHFRIKLGLVINKADIHEESKRAISSFAAKKGIKVHVEIPYDLSVPKAIAAGQPVVASYPDSVSARQLSRLAESLLADVNIIPG
jgi:MinD superfamily P-loop ATPase